jgi:SWI/SNF-related matrix-associated actin-dependent regulator 1 of chromatin subfamily A
MTSTLTEEQKEIIEAKRQLALQRRNERQKLKNQHSSFTTVNSLSNKSPNTREWRPSSRNELYVSADTSNVKKDSFALKSFSKQTRKDPRNEFRQFVHERNPLSTREVVTGNCQLLSKERFTVNVPYQEQMIDIFKSIDSKVYGKLVSSVQLCAKSCNKLLYGIFELTPMRHF